MSLDEKILFKEIKDLIKVPSFKKILYHKVKELKIIMSKDPEHYFKEAEDEDDKSNITKEIEFDLILFGDTVWIPTVSNVDSQYDGYNPFDYIPTEIVYFISGLEIETGVPQMWNNIFVDGKTYDLNFEKKSEVLITGTLIERAAEKERNLLQVDLKNNRIGKMEKVREIITLMLKDEAYYNHVKKEYDKIWQPSFDTVREAIK